MLQKLENATLEWLAYAEYQERVETNPVLAPMAPVEQPEALQLKIRCENRGLPWTAGGLADQPHLLMMEWDVIDSARSKAAKERQKAQALLDKIAAKVASPTGSGSQ